MKFLLILAVIYISFRLFFRYVFPPLVLWFVKKEVKKHTPQSRGKEGDIHIHKRDASQKKKDGEGEYIDFEDVDE